MKPVTPINQKLRDDNKAGLRRHDLRKQGKYANAVDAESLSIDQSTRKSSSASVTQLPVSPGQKLKQAREKHGIALSDMAVKLHLSEGYVKAIELDDFEALPGTTFTRGYIRLYAREVHLTASDLIAAFDDMISEDVIAEEVVNSVSTLKKRATWGDSHISWVSYLVVAVILALAIAWWASKDVIDGKFEGADHVTIVGSNGQLIVETLDGDDIDQVYVEPKAKTVIDLTTKSDIKTNDAITTNNVNKPNDTLELVVAKDSLFMTFTGDCWVRIGDFNNETIHVSLRKAGDVLTVKGVAPFHVKFGDATVVALKFNDQTTLVPEPRGQSNVVNFVLKP